MDARCSAVFGGVPLTPLDHLGSLFMGVVFFPSSPFMGVMLFPSLWLGNASGRGGGGGGGGGGGVVHSLRRTPCFPSVFLPLFYTSLLLFSFLLSFCLHRFLSSVPIFFPLLLLLVFFSLCLSPLSPFPLFFFFNQPLSLPSPSFSLFSF